MAQKSYDKAFAELQQIIQDLQGDSVSIDQLATKLKKANDLLSFCRNRLREVESELHHLDEEE